MSTVRDVLWEFLRGTWGLLWKMFVIVVPIMILLELYEGSRAYRAMVKGWARLVGRLGFTEETAAPTLIGFLFGLAYGGGIIIRDTRRHGLGRRQVFLMSVFLSMVHAIVEDSLILIAVGAGALWVVVFRIFWAAVVTLALGAAATAWVRRRAPSLTTPPWPAAAITDCLREIFGNRDTLRPCGSQRAAATRCAPWSSWRSARRPRRGAR